MIISSSIIYHYRYVVNGRLGQQPLCIVQLNFNGSNTFGTMIICTRRGLFEPVCGNHSARAGGIIGTSFRFSLNIKVCHVFSLESPHRGDSNEYTQYTIFNVKKIHPNCPKSAAMGFFPRNSRTSSK